MLHKVHELYKFYGLYTLLPCDYITILHVNVQWPHDKEALLGLTATFSLSLPLGPDHEQPAMCKEGGLIGNNRNAHRALNSRSKLD